VSSAWTGRLKWKALGLSAATIAALLLSIVLHFAGDVSGSQAAGGFAAVTGLAFVAALMVLVCLPAPVNGSAENASAERR
jgi:hypothetical protein